MNTLIIKEKEEIKDIKTGYCFVHKNGLVEDLFILAQFTGWPDDPTDEQMRYVAINVVSGFSWRGVRSTRADAVKDLICVGNVILTVETE